MSEVCKKGYIQRVGSRDVRFGTRNLVNHMEKFCTRGKSLVKSKHNKTVKIVLVLHFPSSM